MKILLLKDAAATCWSDTIPTVRCKLSIIEYESLKTCITIFNKSKDKQKPLE